MKAGILTLHNADNYGAVLQACSLQHVLSDLGQDNEIIQTDFPKPDEKDMVRPPSAAAAILQKRIKEEDERRHALFENFRIDHLNCSGPVLRSEIDRIESKYSFFITGSDQVWNLRVFGADRCYFLPFTDPSKRFSYAASFGSEELPEYAKAWCSKELKKFARISVREESAKEMIRELTGRDSLVSLDPVLLPERSFFETLYEGKETRPFYFLYMLKYDEDLVSHAKKTAEKDGMELKTVTGTFSPRFGFDSYSRVSVSEWIRLFAQSEGVFTNSFHGTAFSIVFDKPLYVSKLQGDLQSRNGRIEELLKRADMLSAYDKLYAAVPGHAAECLKPCRQESLQYLKEVIDHAKNS